VAELARYRATSVQRPVRAFCRGARIIWRAGAPYQYASTALRSAGSIHPRRAAGGAKPPSGQQATSLCATNTQELDHKHRAALYSAVGCRTGSDKQVLAPLSAPAPQGALPHPAVPYMEAAQLPLPVRE
jgi:hypothetical protein